MVKRKPKKLPRFITLEEFNKMIEHTKNERDKIILQTLFYVGLRNNELKNMRIEDIDLTNKNFTVVCGKGKKDRIIPFPKIFVPELIEWIDKRDRGWFVEGSSNGQISNTHIRRIVKSMSKSAGLRRWWDVHPHSLRHGYGTYLRNKGVSLEEIQELLGHERLETTRIYAHLAKDKLKRAVDDAFG